MKSGRRADCRTNSGMTISIPCRDPNWAHSRRHASAHDRAVLPRLAAVAGVCGQVGGASSDIRHVSDFKAQSAVHGQECIRDFRDQHGDPFGGLVRRNDPIAADGDQYVRARPAMQHRSRGAIAAWAKPLTSETTTPSGARSGRLFAASTFTFRVGQRPNRDLRGGAHPDRSRSHGRRGAPVIEASLRFRPTVFVIMSNPFDDCPGGILRAVQHPIRARFQVLQVVIFGGEPRATAARSGAQLGDRVVRDDGVGGCVDADGVRDARRVVIRMRSPPGRMPGFRNGSTPVADGEVGELV